MAKEVFVENTRIRLEIMKLIDEPFASWKKINVLYVICLPISTALTALVRIFGYV
jgi:hypothetical protein